MTHDAELEDRLIRYCAIDSQSDEASLAAERGEWPSIMKREGKIVLVDKRLGAGPAL